MDNIDDFELDADAVFAHPIDLVEYIAAGSEWPVKRLSETQALISVDFSGQDYQVMLSFDDSEDTLRLTCACDLAIVDAQKANFFELLNFINTKTWFGHFSYDMEHQALVFLYTLVLPENASIKPEQTYTLMSAAPETCRQFMACFEEAQKGNYAHAKMLANAWHRTGGHA